MTKQTSLVGKFQGYGKQCLKRKTKDGCPHISIYTSICVHVHWTNTHTHTWLMENENNTLKVFCTLREYFVLNLILQMISFALQNIILHWKRYCINMKHWVYSCYFSHVDSSSFSWESQKCWVLVLVFWFSVYIHSWLIVTHRYSTLEFESFQFINSAF